jgi:hypothetical protein
VEASSWKRGQKTAAIHDPALTKSWLPFFLAIFEKEASGGEEKDLAWWPVLRLSFFF